MPMSDQVFPQAPAGAILLPMGIGSGRCQISRFSCLPSVCFLLSNVTLSCQDGYRGRCRRPTYLYASAQGQSQ
jgi:hypothetical protein